MSYCGIGVIRKMLGGILAKSWGLPSGILQRRSAKAEFHGASEAERKGIRCKAKGGKSNEARRFEGYGPRGISSKCEADSSKTNLFLPKADWFSSLSSGK